MYSLHEWIHIVKRQNGNVSVSYHFICKRFLYTFVSARGGWVWLPGGGARKLCHSLTTMVRSQNPFFDHSSDQSSFCASEANYQFIGDIISLNGSSSPAPPPPHPGWNTILGRCGCLSLTCHCQCQSSFNYTAGRDREGVCKAYSLFPPTHHYIIMTPYHAICTGTCSLVVGIYPVYDSLHCNIL